MGFPGDLSGEELSSPWGQGAWQRTKGLCIPSLPVWSDCNTARISHLLPFLWHIFRFVMWPALDEVSNIQDGMAVDRSPAVKFSGFSYRSREQVYRDSLAFVVCICSVMADSLKPHGLYSPWNSPGQNTGVCSLSLLQGIFPTQVSHITSRFFTSWALREALNALRPSMLLPPLPLPLHTLLDYFQRIVLWFHAQRP